MYGLCLKRVTPTWSWASYLIQDSFEETFDEAAEGDHLKEAKEKAAESEFLKHPVVLFTLLVRHHWLTRMPWGMLLIPPLKSIYEHSPENSKVAPSTIGHGMLAWVQWFIVLNYSLIHLSFAPELVIASLLPMPRKELGDEF